MPDYLVLVPAFAVRGLAGVGLYDEVVIDDRFVEADIIELEPVFFVFLIIE